LVAPMLPSVWVAKLSAALVLLEVSTASVVVALKVVPAQAESEQKTTIRAAIAPYFRTRTPGLFVAWGNDGISPQKDKLLVSW